jgi:NAD(P)-dependent dehydrogenase (short-subunit alcohol dehydrogenase family)
LRGYVDKKRERSDMDLNLGGKVALVADASRGTGASIAAELARDGVHVCLAARDIAAISGNQRVQPNRSPHGIGPPLS